VTTPEQPTPRAAGETGRFTGSVALVSGASSGVGAVAARRLVAEGACVTLMARREAELGALAREIDRDGEVLVAAGDVRSSSDVDRAVARTVERFGRFDVAIVSAAIGRVCPLPELTDEAWAAYVDTNLTGAFYVCRAAGLRMREASGGAIVNIASSFALIGAAGYAAYCASKAGMVGLTRALAAELAPEVRVNCLCPGGIETPMTEDDHRRYPDPAARRRDALGRTPLGRFATAEEVAGAALWLASDETSFATGAVVPFDGGATTV
jgi:NAD(P)-dependent dehydrogenase (short-subunit alcohol dehydrogenase family)